MNTIKDLNKQQYDLLSWFATYIYNLYVVKDRKIEQYEHGKTQGIQSSCAIIGIPDKMLYDVEFNYNFKGLRNYNKMTEVVIFD